MSVIVIKIKNEENVSMLKKLIGIFKERTTVFSDEGYKDRIASELIDEGLKTEILSEEETRKEYKKRGASY